jgi:2-polyprenyl-3-methyl-5-hydroxy-6-metoxy-1,4-benzoquinol methylase
VISRSARDPRAEIAAGNPWYIEDQVVTQLGTPAFRAVVEDRWRVWEDAIDAWVARRGRPPVRLLDAGCGDGINLSFIERLVRDRCWPTLLHGADYSALRIGRAHAFAAGRLVRTSVTALSFDERAFDVVLCNQVLEHVPDLKGALAELYRVLRPGGLLLIGVPNEGSALGLLRNHVVQRSILRSTDHVNMFTARKLRYSLETSGFCVNQIWTEGFFTPHTVLHAWLHRFRPVRRILRAATRPFPSLAAGLLIAAGRPEQ